MAAGPNPVAAAPGNVNPPSGIPGPSLFNINYNNYNNKSNANSKPSDGRICINNLPNFECFENYVLGRMKSAAPPVK